LSQITGKINFIFGPCSLPFHETGVRLQKNRTPKHYRFERSIVGYGSVLPGNANTICSITTPRPIFHPSRSHHPYLKHRCLSVSDRPAATMPVQKHHQRHHPAPPKRLRSRLPILTLTITQTNQVENTATNPVVCEKRYKVASPIPNTNKNQMVNTSKLASRL